MRAAVVTGRMAMQGVRGALSQELNDSRQRIPVFRSFHFERQIPEPPEALDTQHHRIALFQVSHRRAEIGHRTDRRAVQRRDNVARLEPGVHRVESTRASDDDDACGGPEGGHHRTQRVVEIHPQDVQRFDVALDRIGRVGQLVQRVAHDERRHSKRQLLPAAEHIDLQRACGGC